MSNYTTHVYDENAELRKRIADLEKDCDYCEKRWNEALATHENIAALKSRIAELEAALREAGIALKEHAIDSVRQEAAEYHATMAGYKPKRHEAMDESVRVVERAIATIDNLLKD